MPVTIDKNRLEFFRLRSILLWFSVTFQGGILLPIKMPSVPAYTLTCTGSGPEQGVANSRDQGGESSKTVLELLFGHFIPSEVCMRTTWRGHAAVALIFSVHPLRTEVFVCQ